MKRVFVFGLAFSLFLSFLLAVPQSSAQSSSASIQDFFKSYFEETLKDEPEYATNVGRHDYDDRWSDLSKAGRDQRLEHMRSRLADLSKFKLDSLSGQDQLSARLLKYDLTSQIEANDLGVISFASASSTASIIASMSLLIACPRARRATTRTFCPASTEFLHILIKTSPFSMKPFRKAGRSPPSLLTLSANKSLRNSRRKRKIPRSSHLFAISRQTSRPISKPSSAPKPNRPTTGNFFPPGTSCKIT